MAPNGPNAQVDRGNATLADNQARPGFVERSEFDSCVADFHRAYEENNDDLLRYARGRVHSKEVAQDIVQQAFTNTLVAIERGADIRNVGGFVQRCVHNLCVNHTVREPHVSLQGEILGMSDCSTTTSVEHRARWGELERVVDQLAQSQRDVFLLAEVRGCSYDEIAQTTGRSIESVRQLLYRARRIVRAKGDKDADWAVGPFPVFGLDQIVSANGSAGTLKIGSWVRGKASELQAWLGNICQGSTDALLQPGVSVVTGAVVVALATVSPGPLNKPDSLSEDTGSSVTQRSKHSASQPFTSTVVTNAVDTGRPTVSRSPFGNARDAIGDRDSKGRDAPAKKTEDEEPESIIASDPGSDEIPDPSTGQGENENPGGGGESEQPCDLGRSQEQCDKEAPEVSIPCPGDCLPSDHNGGPPAGNPLGEGPDENPGEQPPTPINEPINSPDNESDPFLQMEPMVEPEPAGDQNNFISAGPRT